MIGEQVLELQSTLEELSSRVDKVKEENYRLRSENQVNIYAKKMDMKNGWWSK